MTCVCDSDASKVGGMLDGVRIVSLDELKRAHQNEMIIISVKDNRAQEEIKRNLENEGFTKIEVYEDVLQMNNVEFNREFCADFHIEKMDDYFERAEEADWLGVFWREDSVFYKMFQQLDLANVVELACGRGRHVQKYLDQAGHVTLVDILEKNIEYCRERFQGDSRIDYYKNNGYDLEKIKSESCTALFTYDAMVHFESMDIYQYLQETFRILCPGGKALFHHSNNYSDYKASFRNAPPHGRAFMSKDLFAHYCYKAGLTVLEQHVIDWGEEGRNRVIGLDCVTLVQR